MIYLIKNLSTRYVIVVTNLSELPQDESHTLARGETSMTYNVSGVEFADVVYLPHSPDPASPPHVMLLDMVNTFYQKNREIIINENKNKFIIAAVQLKNDGSREVIHADAYTNLMRDTATYNKLPENGPMHHYEIYNYSSDSFEICIRKEDAVKKIISYMDRFIDEYKPNIVKEFWYDGTFLDYITTEV